MVLFLRLRKLKLISYKLKEKLMVGGEFSVFVFSVFGGSCFFVLGVWVLWCLVIVIVIIVICVFLF